MTKKPVSAYDFTYEFTPECSKALRGNVFIRTENDIQQAQWIVSMICGMAAMCGCAAFSVVFCAAMIDVNAKTS